MIKPVLFFSCFILLSGCSDISEEPIPHNRVTREETKEDTVTFSFEETNRFKKTDFNLGLPNIQLVNGTYTDLKTDFSLTVDYYDDGWQEIDTIDYYVREYPYELPKEENLTYSLFTDHFEQPLESGRYRLSLDYSFVDRGDNNKDEGNKIGTVFWIED